MLPDKPYAQPPAPAPGVEFGVIDPFQRVEPRALINLVDSKTQKYFLEQHEKRPELFGQDETDLMIHLRAAGKSPTVTDNRLRIKFWCEYDRAQEAGTQMDMRSVYGRICTPNYFYEKYLQTPERVAWLITMPASYENKMAEFLEFSVEQMRDIMGLDHMAGGRPNVKLMEMKTKIYAMVEARQKGGIIQKSMQLQVHSGDKEVAKLAMTGSMEEIENRLKDLASRERAILKQNERYGEKDTDKQMIDVKSDVAE